MAKEKKQFRELSEKELEKVTGGKEQLSKECTNSAMKINLTPLGNK